MRSFDVGVLGSSFPELRAPAGRHASPRKQTPLAPPPDTAPRPNPPELSALILPTRPTQHVLPSAAAPPALRGPHRSVPPSQGRARRVRGPGGVVAALLAQVARVRDPLGRHAGALGDGAHLLLPRRVPRHLCRGHDNLLGRRPRHDRQLRRLGRAHLRHHRVPPRPAAQPRLRPPPLRLLGRLHRAHPRSLGRPRLRNGVAPLPWLRFCGRRRAPADADHTHHPPSGRRHRADRRVLPGAVQPAAVLRRLDLHRVAGGAGVRGAPADGAGRGEPGGEEVPRVLVGAVQEAAGRGGSGAGEGRGRRAGTRAGAAKGRRGGGRRGPHGRGDASAAAGAGGRGGGGGGRHPRYRVRGAGEGAGELWRRCGRGRDAGRGKREGVNLPGIEDL